MKKIMITTLIAIVTAGCTVGPDYKAQKMIDPDFSSVLNDGKKGNIDNKQLANWWKGFDDAMLTSLIQRSLDGNLSMKEAQSKIMESRARLGIAGTPYYPSLDLNTGYNRREVSTNSGGTGKQTSHYNASFDARWEIDLFGGTRRSVEAAEADLEAQEVNLKSVWVSLAAEVANSYVSLRTSQKLFQVANNNLKAQQNTLDILKSRYQNGLSNELAVHQARYNLETTRSTIPSIVSSVESSMNALALLIGVMPGTLAKELNFSAPVPVPAESVKCVTGIPANAMRQRPDIRLAERQLAAQTARIGVAESDLYPKFMLNGSIGLESLQGSNLFESNSKGFGFGPSLSWPIFNAGEIRNNIKVQGAIQEQFKLRYEQTVLNATKEIRDALTDYAQEQIRYTTLKDAVESATIAEELSQDQYKNGITDFNNVLDSQRSLLQLQAQLTASEGTISQNLIRVYKSLGGGWTHLQPEQK